MSRRRFGVVAGAACIASMVAIAGRLGACAGENGAGGSTIDGVETTPVRVNGQRLDVEVAADDPTRIRGLGGRDHIPENGGMLFVFPQSASMGFVMRDCPIAIDIAYLDGAGRVVSMHEMQPEPAQGPEEADFEYEQRLKRYPSGFPARFALETAGGRLRALGLKVGDRVEFDVEGLKNRAE